MKLDDKVIEKIRKIVYEYMDGYEPYMDDEQFCKRLQELDLVTKDSSQSILVENK